MSSLAKRLPIIMVITSLSLAACAPSVDERMARAREQVGDNDYRAATIELKNVLKEDADHLQARLLLAQVALGLGDAASAEKEMERALELGADRADHLPLFFKIQLNLGKFAQVIEGTGEDRWPAGADELERQILRGEAFLGLRSWHAAAEAYDRARALSPQSGEAMVGQARVAVALGDQDQARQFLEEALAADPANVTAWQITGHMALLEGDTDAAEAALSSAVEASRTRVDFLQRARSLAALADVQLARRKVGEARASLDELTGIAPGSFPTRFLAGRVLHAEGRLDESAAELQALSSDYPQALQVEFLLAAVQADRGNLGQAEQGLTRVVALSPDNTAARKLLARVQMKLGRPQAAAQMLAPVMGAGPDDPEMLAIAGSARMGSGEHDLAVEYFRQASEAAPENWGLKLELAAALMAAGRGGEAIAVLESVPENTPGDYRRELLLLLGHAAEGNAEKGREEIERFLATRRDDVKALNLVGGWYLSQSEPGRAREYLDAALELDGSAVTTLVNLARLEFAEKDNARAREYLGMLRAMDEGNLAGLQGLAQLAYREGDREEALRLLQEARGRHPQALAVRLSLARFLIEMDNEQEATEVAGEALELAPDKPEVLALSGDVALAGNRAREALGFYKDWTDREPGTAASYLGEARAYLALNEDPAARRALGKALELKPGWMPAETAMALLDLKEGNSTSAMNRAQRLVRETPDGPGPQLLVGDIAMRTGDYPLALASYRKAFDLQPATATALRVFQAAVKAGEKTPEAGLEDWLEKNPGDYSAGFALAEYYQREGEDAFAVRVYEQMLKSRPEDVVTLNNLAWVLHQMGDPRAENYARQAYRLRPDFPPVTDTLGWVLVTSGELEEGHKLLRSAANAAPSNRQIQYHLAYALSKVGENGESRAILERILETTGSEAWEKDARELLDSL